MSNRSCLCCRDVGPKGTNGKHRLEEHFNSGILTGGKTRMAPKPSKTTTAWWLASNSQNMPLIIKCQINSQLKPDLPQHKPGSPWENWSLPTTSQLHLVCTTLSLLRTILDPVARWLSQSCGSYAAAFAVEIWVQLLTRTAWKNTCGTLPASLRVARLGWLPRQTNPTCMLAGIELENHASGHEISNQQSVEARSSPTQTCIALGKTGRYLQLRSFTFFHYMISTRDHFRPGGCPKVVVPMQLPLL